MRGTSLNMKELSILARRQNAPDKVDRRREREAIGRDCLTHRQTHRPAGGRCGLFVTGRAQDPRPR